MRYDDEGPRVWGGRFAMELVSDCASDGMDPLLCVVVIAKEFREAIRLRGKGPDGFMEEAIEFVAEDAPWAQHVVTKRDIKEFLQGGQALLELLFENYVKKTRATLFSWRLEGFVPNR